MRVAPSRRTNPLSVAVAEGGITLNYLQIASLIMRYERLLQEEKRPYIRSNIRRTIWQLTERLEKELKQEGITLP